MAEEPIKQDDIIEKDIFENTKDSAEALLIKTNALIAAFKQLITLTGKKIPLSDPKTLTEAEQLADALKKIIQLENGLTEAQKAQIKAQMLLNKQKADFRNQLKAETSAYKELENRYASAAQKAKDLAVAYGIQSKAAKDAAKVANDLNNQLKAVDLTFGVGNRSVGLYKEQIKDALSETGLFDTGIGKLTSVLGKLKEQFKANAEESGKFSASLKVGLVALAVAFAAVYKELTEVNQGFRDFMEDFTANIKDVISSGQEYQILAKMIREARYETIAYNYAIQQNARDQQDNLDISNDATIGFKERNKALLESMRLGKLVAEGNTLIAKSELAIIEQTIKANQSNYLSGSKESIAMLEERAKAVQKLKNAENAESSLVRQNAETIRKINVEKAISESELLRSKKLSANQQTAILTQQLNDEKKQIEERELINKKLSDENKRTTKEEIDIVQKRTGVYFDANKLLNEQDAIKLKEKIESIKQLDENNNLVGIGIDLQNQIAKIVKEAQTNEIENLKNKEKLEQERIKRLERISEIEKEIRIIIATDKISDAKKILTQREEIYQKSTEEIFKNENLFNFKMQKLRDYQFDEVQSEEESLLNLQKKFLTEQEKNAEIKANNTISDTEVLNAEIIKLQKQLEIDLQNIEDDAFIKEEKRNEEKLKEDKKLRDARIDYAIDYAFDTANRINKGIADGLSKRNDIQQQADQADIDMRQRMLDVQTRLASEGKDNALGDTLAQQAKAEEQKIQDAKRAAKQQENLALIETFSSTLQAALKADKPFLQAFGEALAAEGLVEASFSKLFSGFYEGTEDTGTSRNPLDNKGGRIAILHDNERVIPKRLNKDLDGISNDELVNNALAYQNADLQSTVYPKVSVDKAIINMQIDSITAKVQEGVERAFEKMPTSQNNLDGLGEWTEKIQKNNINTIIHHKRNVSRPSLRLNG